MNEIANLLSGITSDKSTASLFLVLLMVGGRAYHGAVNHGGLKGIWNALMFGTNAPAPTDPPKKSDSSNISGTLGLMVAGVACVSIAAGCARFTSQITETDGTKTKTTTVSAYTIFDSSSELAKLKTGQVESNHGKSQSISLGTLNQESSATNASPGQILGEALAIVIKAK